MRRHMAIAIASMMVRIRCCDRLAGSINIRPRSLALVFCCQPGLARELRSQFRTLAAGPIQWIIPNLAASAGTDTNPAVPTPVGCGRGGRERECPTAGIPTTAPLEEVAAGLGVTFSI